jgi:DNA repair protein RadC
MTKEEELAEKAVLKKILEAEQQIFGGFPRKKPSEDQIREVIERHLSENYDKNVIVVHAHHSNWPATGRPRPLQTDLKGMKSLVEFGVQAVAGTENCRCNTPPSSG